MKKTKSLMLVLLVAGIVSVGGMLVTGCTKVGEKAKSPAATSKTPIANKTTPANETPVAKETTVGAPYPLDTCPVSEAELGSMGEPIVYDHQGRDIRFCCKGCVDKFEADPDKYLKEVDAQIIAAQLPKYPIDTCLVTGEELDGEMGEAINYVHNNILVRFCCQGCVKDFKADPDKYMANLN